MTTPGIKITFNEDMGCYTAEEPGPGSCVAFGKTPEEAVAKLEFAKTLWADCESCRSEDASAEADPGHHH